MKISRNLLISAVLLLASATSFVHAKNDKCTAPAGVVLRGYGKNLAPNKPNVFVKCAAFDDNGCRVGYEETYDVGPVAASHKWVLNDGCLDVTFDRSSDLLFTQPVDEVAVAAFPEVAPYLNNPNAVLFIFTGNHTKHNDPGTVSWKASGSLKKSNYVEVRCVFLTFIENGAPVVQQCLGSHWFIGRK